MDFSRLSRESAIAVLAVCMWCVAAPGPGVVRPWDDTGTPLDVARPTGSSAILVVVDSQTGADHIVGQQCGNGGWGWPHADCSATYNNITAPICLGLLEVYPNTGDIDHLNSAIAGAGYDLTSQYVNGEARFSTFTPFFMKRLSMHTGDSQYSDFAATEFFDELSAGTYGPSDLNTAGWIAAVQAGRAGTWINLLPWEFHTLIWAAATNGNPGQEAAFRQALLDGLNTLDNTQPFIVYSDLLGLAGGVRGLALGGTTSFAAINSPNHSGINGLSTLKDLADTLASYQNANGSWYWHSNIPGPVASDEDTQTTAYAVLALNVADPLVSSDYSAAIALGRSWIDSMQLLSGGFLSYPGGDENTEIEGEALTATADPKKTIAAPGDDCATAVPAPGGLDPCAGDLTGGPLVGACIASPSLYDVWVSFVAPATSTRVRTDLSSPGTDSAYIVWDACGGNPIGCSEDEVGFRGNICVGGLTVGNTYYVQLGAWAAGLVFGPYNPYLYSCGVYNVDIQAAGTCGDTILDCGETCDPPGPCCSATCQTIEICGDNVTCGAEACDGTDDAACPGLCAADCTCNLPRCGDNIVNQASEECDGTAQPGCGAGAYCRTDCICAQGIPAVSEWGLAVLTLIGLVSGTILFGRRRSAVH